MGTRRKLSRLDREHVWAMGQRRCHICGEAVGLDEMQVSHPIPLAAGGRDVPDNRAPAHAPCHARRTAKVDLPMIAKVRRLARRHAGIKRKVRYPLPCGKRSGWSKPVHGGAVRRVCAEAKHRAAMSADRSAALAARFAAFQAKRGLLIEQLER